MAYEDWDIENGYDIQGYGENDIYYDEEPYHPAEILQARVEYYDFKLEWTDLLNNCVLSVVWQSVSAVKTLLACCLAFRFVPFVFQSVLSGRTGLHHIIHITGIFLGLVSLHSINWERFYSTVLIMLIYIVCTFMIFSIFTWLKLTCGRTVSLFTVLYLIVGELALDQPQHWHQIRGVLLLLAMKSISTAFDLDAKLILKVPNPFAYAAYCLHCGTLLFGPWITFKDYMNSVTNPKPLTVIWVISLFRSLALALLCLALSSCVFSYLFLDGAQPELPSVTPFVANRWMLSYQSAISFHFSHFYISYLSLVTCMLSGVGSSADSVDGSWSDFVITKPLAVEFPTSMLNVVIAWNVPMSKWLKKYVYSAYQFLGRTTAVLLTYAASAMLHGLSFHLAAVLLSLAFYTYAEYSLRRKLSLLLNCEHIQARPKLSQCQTVVPLWARVVNLAWVLVNLMHLSYLGAMFQSEDESIAQEGYHMQHTIEKWSNLGFTSHIFALFCCLISWVLGFLMGNRE